MANNYERHMREQNIRIQKLEIQNKQLLSQLEMKDKIITAFKEKNAFKAVKGRPTMIVRVGSVEKGWIPNPSHFAAVTVRIKHAKLDEQYNIVLSHAFTTFERVD